MALPLTRDYDAVDAGPLNATVVNNLQDAIVLHKHGRIVRHFGIEGGLRGSAWTIETLNQSWFEITADQFAQNLQRTLTLSVGARIHTVSAWVRSAAIGAGTFGDGITMLVQSVVPSTGWTLTTLGAIVESAHDGTDEKITLDLTGTPHTILTDEPIQVRFRVDSTTADNAVGNVLRLYPIIEVDYDRP